MTSKTIKDFFKNKHGLKKVRVECGKNFVRAWIVSEPYVNVRDPLVFKEEFPLPFRVKCLEIIYPGMSENSRGSAGNIGAHSLAMHRDQWEKAME
jgi:hypothetical protein